MVYGAVKMGSRRVDVHLGRNVSMEKSRALFAGSVKLRRNNGPLTPALSPSEGERGGSPGEIFCRFRHTLNLAWRVASYATLALALLVLAGCNKSSSAPSTQIS